MSFCGHAARSPGAPVAVERMLRAVTLGSPRTMRQWAGDGVRLGASDGAALATGPGERTALIDGEIHNRDALAAALGVDGPAGVDDAALLLAAQARWGDDFADHVVGDYAALVWDARARRMVMAVDPGGMRPLMLWHTDADLRFANEARGLWADPAVDRVLDDDRVARWLALVPAEPDQTLFRGIRRVPPGGRAIWQDGALRIDRWWHPERLPMLRLAGHGDYADAVRACLETAVACRLGSDARVGSNLSGGLDSSAVTALAARRLADDGRTLAAFTATPAHRIADPPGRFGDEWAHAAALAGMYPNVEHVRVSNADMPLMGIFDVREGAQDMPLFNVSNSVWNNAIEREARDRHVTIMLVGNAGNMTFSYDGALLMTQLMRRGRIDKALALALTARRLHGSRWLTVPAMLADAGLPRRWSDALRRLTGRRTIALSDYSAIRPDFLERAGLGGETARRGGDLRNLHPHDGRALRLAALRRLEIVGEFATGTRRLYGVDMRDPTADRRLAELCLSIPEEQFRHVGIPRAIARTALADVLPPTIVGEYRKGLQASDWAHGFDDAVPALKAEIARQRASRSAPDWIDLDRIDRVLDRWSGPDGGDAVEVVAITRALAVGRFVRRIEGGNG